MVPPSTLVPEGKLGTSAKEIPARANSSAQLAPDKDRWASATIFAIAGFAVAIRLFFWYYTRRTWEDALISTQHAVNAARGMGLTHFAGGPHVHGFTSPLSMLIPLVGELIHPEFGLTLIKFVSAICGGISVWLAMRICQRLQLSFPVTVLVGGYLAIEHQQILFGMAGMETQIAVTIILLSIYSLFDLKPHLVGITLGLCMLARPDFCLWVPVVLALAAWPCWKQRTFQPLETMGLDLLLIYGPWLAFTTWYYGGPIPNTILAKAWGYGTSWYAGMSASAVVLGLLIRVRRIFALLGPSYGGHGMGFSLFHNWQMLIFLAVLFFAVVGMIATLRRRTLPALAVTLFVFVYSVYYLVFVSVVAPWYCMPLAAVAIVAAGIGLDATLRELFAARGRTIVGYGLAAAYLASLAIYMPASFRDEKNIQTFVEDGVRKKIGLYLADVMTPGQTIGCEPLGYIGYYSKHLIYDFPGLCNRQVTHWFHMHPMKAKSADYTFRRKALMTSMIEMFGHFRPDYIVLRPEEYQTAVDNQQEWFLTGYREVAVFRVSDKDRSELLFPHDNLDLEYHVFKRIADVQQDRLPATSPSTN